MRPTARRARPLFGLTVLSCLLAPAVTAQTASLVKDIRPGRNAFRVSASPGDLWALKGKVLFSASEPSSGRELWISDGTGSGTRMLADFFPGEDPSHPQILGTSGSLLFGFAFHEPFGSPSLASRAYLWRSDGTQEGTFLLPDPLFQVGLPYDEGAQESGEIPVPVALDAQGAWFTGCIDHEGCGLWRTDGTVAGTRRLRQFPSSSVTGLTLAGGRLFFATVRQLWMSDGTPEGTILVRELPQGTPRRLAALGDKVLFLLQDQFFSFGEELWVSDGTEAGTRALTNFEVAKPFEQTNFLKPLDGKVYFVADDATHGAELWASDGTAAGTVRLTDFGFHDPFNGPDNSFGPGLPSRALANLGSRVIFWAHDGLTRFKPWSSQGTPQTTAPLCSTCTFFDELSPFFPIQGKLLFRARGDDHGAELWTTDGTAAGTKLLKDVCPGLCSGVIGALALLPGALFFEGAGGASQGGAALWMTDGTAQGTRRFADVQPTGGPAVAGLGKKVLFSALVDREDPLSEPDLWVSDGTPAGTRPLSVNGSSGRHADPTQLVSAGNQLFFTAFDDGERSFVWRSAGTEADTHPTLEPVSAGWQLTTAGGTVFLIEGGCRSCNRLSRVDAGGRIERLTNLPEAHRISYPVSFQGRLFFAVNADNNLGSEIWKSDGTPDGTGPALTLSADLSDLRYLEAAGGRLWFLANRSSAGTEVWVTDGTAGGTHMVLALPRTDVDPEFTQSGSSVYFVAVRHNFEVWKSDGTPQGTVAVPGFSASSSTLLPAELTSLQGNFYFFADLSPTRSGLWRTDGTAAGTVLVKDFVRPKTFVFEGIPRPGLTALGSQLVFAADDGVHGREPWHSDGTTAGTALLRDVFSGIGSSELTGFREAAGKLYFSATDGAHGFEPWRTDGTPEGTRLVQDIAPQGASSYPAGFTAAGNHLFFSADDRLTGNELWALPLSGPACQPSATALCLNDGRFRVEARWRIPSGFHTFTDGVGQAVPLTGDTGTFWFFDQANVEAILKVLDGQGVNGHFWVFYGALSDVEYTLTVTDTQTGLAHRYFNAQGQLASVGDTQAFGPQGVHETKLAAHSSEPPFVSERFAAAAATATCVPAAARLCLNGGRFAVEAAWKDFGDRTGTGTAVSLTGDTGYFWFFDAANVEAVVKVLDGTPVNGRYWLFYGALSNVEYTLTVTDTVTGKVKTYKNPRGNFGSLADTAAF